MESTSIKTTEEVSRRSVTFSKGSLFFILIPLLINIASGQQQSSSLEREELSSKSDALLPPGLDPEEDLSWTPEEVTPKEMNSTSIHVKIMKPISRTIDIWESRQEEAYLKGLNLGFDSPFKKLSIDNCSLDFRSYSDRSSHPLSTHADLKPSVGNIQLQISGGLQCNFLPFHALSRHEKGNLTHLVIRDTGIDTIPRFLFRKARLETLTRIDVIENQNLTQIHGRAFDGLDRLTYLSLINNLHLQELDTESFRGAKSLEELIFIGNGFGWNWTYNQPAVGNGGKILRSVLRAASSKILPNLVHLHLSRKPIFSPSIKSSLPSHYHDKRSVFHFPSLDSPDALTSTTESSGHISFALLSVITTILLLLTGVILVIAFVYESTLKNLFTMVEDDFLHTFSYDAFVSYNVNDAEWIFNKLIPNLEGKEISRDGHSSVSSSSLSKNEIKLCVYDRDFVAGRSITECITDAIKNSRKVILVISRNFVLSPWCRFETDVAHNILMDQNREGLILIKLENLGSHEALESVAPQLNFLLKTRIYLDWTGSSEEIFWKKLRRSLGFTSYAPYGAVKQYYQNYWLKANTNRIRVSNKKAIAESEETSSAAAVSFPSLSSLSSTSPSSSSSSCSASSSDQLSCLSASDLVEKTRKIECRDVLVPRLEQIYCTT